MSDFSRILELYEELLNTVRLQQIHINQLRREVAQQAQSINNLVQQQQNQEAA
ncbi:hypothetical protein MO867_20165 [Microbulbifer sp. OS29]|uniref:Uncharacterized protein n=1 Tax=Microbulbifer okhotskensis TaxID=2926617 RepID=A0A9X2J7I8_9GAMM|nr:hypothetical protein [Microbulbifer okhotskensis]MCO1336644.1 hypothetical protein [Microbulbifer okhotskensis]